MFELLNDINDRVNYPLLVEMPTQLPTLPDVTAEHRAALYKFATDSNLPSVPGLHKDVVHVYLEEPKEHLFVALDHASKMIDYESRFRDVIYPVAHCWCQTWVWKSKTALPRFQNLPSDILFKVVLPRHPLVSDGKQTPEGKGLWQRLVVEALSAGFRVYAVQVGPGAKFVEKISIISLHHFNEVCDKYYPTGGGQNFRFIVSKVEI